MRNGRSVCDIRIPLLSVPEGPIVFWRAGVECGNINIAGNPMPFHTEGKHFLSRSYKALTETNSIKIWQRQITDCRQIRKVQLCPVIVLARFKSPHTAGAGFLKGRKINIDRFALLKSAHGPEPFV